MQKHNVGDDLPSSVKHSPNLAMSLHIQLPIWNGEFGPVYQNADDGLEDWEKINTSRYHVLKTQLGIYAKNNTSWSIWLYKDLGFQGMQYVKKDTAYMKRLAPFLKKKKVSRIDISVQQRRGGIS